MTALASLGRLILGLTVILGLGVGCASYHATISVKPPAGSAESAVLSDADQARVQAAISKAALDRGLKVNPRLRYPVHMTGEDPSWDKEVVASFITPPWATGFVETINVLCLVDKADGQYSVDIWQINEFPAKGKTLKVEAAVLEAMEATLGPGRIQIERRKAGYYPGK